MKCDTCGKMCIEKKGCYEFKSKVAGIVSVPDIKYWECSNCHKRQLLLSELQKVVDYVSNKEGSLISEQPYKLFISAKQAAQILGITKQAFSKNVRIARGFILSGIIDDRKHYLKKSVEQFKTTNDGRINLTTKEQYSTPPLWKHSYTNIVNFRKKETVETTEGAVKYE